MSLILNKASIADIHYAWIQLKNWSYYGSHSN